MSAQTTDYGLCTDSELINRCVLQHDKGAFDTLMTRNQDMVFRMCYKLLGNYDDALEVSQEVFLTCYRKLDKFEGKSKFSSWLYRMTLNHCKNFWRRQNRSATHKAISIDKPYTGEEDHTIQIAVEDPDPREQATSRQLKEIIFQRMQNLTPEHREILILQFSENLSYDEIAEIVVCPVGTVKSRINRARRELKNLLQDIWEQSK